MRVRDALTPLVSQELWAPNGSMLRSFNIAERRSVPKIARLERHGLTIFPIRNCQDIRWLAILAGLEPLSTMCSPRALGYWAA
jgi:hypothetical protein